MQMKGRSEGREGSQLEIEVCDPTGRVSLAHEIRNDVGGVEKLPKVIGSIVIWVKPPPRPQGLKRPYS